MTIRFFLPTAFLAGMTINDNRDPPGKTGKTPKKDKKFLKDETKNFESKKRLYREEKFHKAIEEADQVVKKFKEQYGVPGISVGVSVDGRIVWKTGYGYADLENLQPCTGDSVMRIASISKSLTMTLVAKLMQENRLDLDAPIQKYVPNFPEKEIDGEKVVMTTRHLVSHMSGIRHYTNGVPRPETDQEKSIKSPSNEKIDEKSTPENMSPINRQIFSSLCEKCQPRMKEIVEKSEIENEEVYSQKQYKSVTEALSMFKDDPLLFKPGSKYSYTTHGYTLVSAVIEGASGEKFPILFNKMFSIFGMHQTYLDWNLALIPNRSKYYRRSLKNGYRLENVPSVNNSYKWAGGGVVSTVGDLLRFADTMLYFYQHCPEETTRKSCYLNKKTLEKIWTPVAGAGTYAMGWGVSPNHRLTNENGEFYVGHGGANIGASSMLLIKPTRDENGKNIAVAILTNLGHYGGVSGLAGVLARIFDGCDTAEDTEGS